MASIDLKALASLPFAGMAEAELRRAGAWDDLAIVDGRRKMMFKVAVTGPYDPEPETTHVNVEAFTQDEAIDLAEDMTDFHHIEEVKVISAKESKDD